MASRRFGSKISRALILPLADHQSMSAARFVTHLRYLFVRLQSGRQFEGEVPTVRDAVVLAHPEAYRAAQRIRYLLTVNDQSLSEDEITYLTLHIARLAAVSDHRS